MQHDFEDLSDGDAPSTDVPHWRQWAASQRFVDGLIRAGRVDPTAEEDTVASIMRRLDEPRRMPLSWSRAQVAPHRVLLVAAASLLAGLLLWPLMLSEQLPEARASVMRAADALMDGGDRGFEVTMDSFEQGGEHTVQRLDLTMRPGRKFLVAGPLQLGPIRFEAMRFGSDGAEFWFEAPQQGESEILRRSGPLAEAPSLLRGIGSLLDMGMLDVHACVTELPKNCALRTTGRSVDAHGRHFVHIEATGAEVQPGFRLQRAELVCCVDTGSIESLVVEGDDGLGTQHRLRFQDLGPRIAHATQYQRPW